MAIFTVMTKGAERDLHALGRTGAMKGVMEALEDIGKNDDNPNTANWKKVREKFKKFGFKVVYDRNMAILITALFAAVARSNCTELKSSAKLVVNQTTEVPTKNGQSTREINLGPALLEGNGKAAYDILMDQGHFNQMLSDMGLGEYVTKFLNRVKKITPWRRSGSINVLEKVERAFEQMTRKEYSLESSETSLEKFISKLDSVFDDTTEFLKRYGSPITENFKTLCNMIAEIDTAPQKLLVLKNAKKITANTKNLCSILHDNTKKFDKLLNDVKKYYNTSDDGDDDDDDDWGDFFEKLDAGMGRKFENILSQSKFLATEVLNLLAKTFTDVAEIETSKFQQMNYPGELSEEEMAPDLSMKKLLLAKKQLSTYKLDYLNIHSDAYDPLLAVFVLSDGILTFIEAKYESTKSGDPKKRYWAQEMMVDLVDEMSGLIQGVVGELEKVFPKQ